MAAQKKQNLSEVRLFINAQSSIHCLHFIYVRKILRSTHLKIKEMCLII